MFSGALAFGLGAILLVPGVALAARTVTITGGGWGHGLGMSQYGAYGRALNGKSAQQILTHYYTGVDVAHQKMPVVRVGLLQYEDSITLTSSAFSNGGGDVTWHVVGTQTPVASGGSGVAWKVTPSSTGGMHLFKDGKQVQIKHNGVLGDGSHPLALSYQNHHSLVHVDQKNNSYAYGHMFFGTFSTSRCSGGQCLRLVAVMSMQHYLYGLGEVPASWPQAALQAQAIAGRTYAFAKSKATGGHRYPCDCTVYDSTLDQAYIGDAKRTGSGKYWNDWTSAVDATDGEAVEYNNNPIDALYMSSSGGHTENNENVWGGSPVPYLRGVSDGPDAVSANPNHKWTVQMSFTDFQSKLNAAYGVGAVKAFKLVKPFGVSGRVTVVKPNGAGGVKVAGSTKTVRESGWSVRAALGLRDTLFRVNLGYAVAPVFQHRYDALSHAPGDPKGDSYAVPPKKILGRAQNFSKGRMTWRKQTGKVVWQWGRVLARYDRLGREASTLGMPVSDVWGKRAYKGATYVNGIIVWSRKTGAHQVVGDFQSAYAVNGGPGGPLSLPTASAARSKMLPHNGSEQRFQAGTLYRNPAKGVFALWGGIDARYKKIGEATSKCGYPVATMVVTDQGATASFEHGTISQTTGGDVRVVCKH